MKKIKETTWWAILSILIEVIGFCAGIKTLWSKTEYKYIENVYYIEIYINE